MPWTNLSGEWSELWNAWWGVTHDPSAKFLTINQGKAAKILLEETGFVSNTLYIRDEYKFLYDKATILLSRKGSGIILSGSPGTGKSISLVYFLRRRAADRLTTLFTTAYRKETYQFSPSGVSYQDASGIKREDIPRADPLPWSLIDTPKSRDKHPAPSVWLPGVLPIQAASPDESAYKDLVTVRRAITWCILPWSMKEIREILPLQGEYRIASPTRQREMVQNLEGVIETYGPFNARTIMTALDDPLGALENLDDALAELRDDDIRKVLRAARVSPSAVSHRLFGLIRFVSHSNGRDEYAVQLASPYIIRKVREIMTLIHLYTAQQLIRIYRLAPESGALAGWMFESVVGGIICGRSMRKDPLPLIPMQRTAVSTKIAYSCQIHEPADDQSMDVDPGSPVIDIYEREVRLFGGSNKVAVDNKGYYMVVASNHPLFDTFCFDISENKIVINAFQMTTAPRHGGFSKDYAHLADLLTKAHHVKGLGGKKSEVSIRYILAVPSQPEHRVTWDLPDGFSENTCEGVYALSIPVPYGLAP